MNTELQFDEYGYLKPYESILTDIAIFEEVFVNGFPNSITRRALFERYKVFNQLIHEMLPSGYVQCIDGSFVSRKRDPDDIFEL